MITLNATNQSIAVKKNILTMHWSWNRQLLTYRTNCQLVSRWTQQFKFRRSCGLRSSKVMCGGRPDLKNSPGSSTLADFSAAPVVQLAALTSSHSPGLTTGLLTINLPRPIITLMFIWWNFFRPGCVVSPESGTPGNRFAAFLRTGSQRLNWGHRGQTLWPQM